MNQTRLIAEASRLLPLAREVLTRYEFRVKHVDHLATHSNVLYRVVANDGRQMVLRVGTPDSNSRSNLQVEVDWLDALARETDLDVVSPIPTVAGRYITDVVDPKSGRRRHCVLFSWVPGAPLGDGAGPFSYRLLGQMLARLQAHGKTWVPPDPDLLRHWDRIFYYRSDDPLVIFSARTTQMLGHQTIGTIKRAMPVAERVIADTWANGAPQIVHGDLHEWNAHVVATRLYAFDFEDVMMATPAQDVSVCLYSSRAAPRSKEIVGAFREGFEEFGTWPIESAFQLDGLHAARQIMLMNYAISALPELEAVEYVAKVMPWMDQFVKQYA